MRHHFFVVQDWSGMWFLLVQCVVAVEQNILEGASVSGLKAVPHIPDDEDYEFLEVRMGHEHTESREQSPLDAATVSILERLLQAGAEKSNRHKGPLPTTERVSESVTITARSRRTCRWELTFIAHRARVEKLLCRDKLRACRKSTKD